MGSCYADPDWAGTSFKCDDAHGCPPGQTCILGLCTRSESSGSGSGSGDGGSTGGGPDGGGSGSVADGVVCGDVVCTSAQKCCMDVILRPRCLRLDDPCSGSFATCDGREDCEGAPCCMTSTSGVQVVCGSPGCHASCRDADDCTDPLKPMCCPTMIGTAPWGHCAGSC